MKETTINYVESRINHASRFPGNATMVDLFENQAFGAVELACMVLYKEEPEAEAELLKRWNDEWSIKFFNIKFPR